MKQPLDLLDELGDYVKEENWDAEIGFITADGKRFSYLNVWAPSNTGSIPTATVTLDTGTDEFVWGHHFEHRCPADDLDVAAFHIRESVK